MDLFSLIAMLLTLAAVFIWINKRTLKMPTTIGVMVIALAASPLLLLLQKLGFDSSHHAQSVLEDVHFDKTVLGGMLAFLLFAGALHVDLGGLVQQRGIIALLATCGVVLSTGIVGVLASRMREEGLEVVSLWAGLPHYIAATPNSRGVLALVHKVTQVLDFRVDEAPLQRSAAEFEGRIAELVASDPALAEYVKDLKRREFAQ